MSLSKIPCALALAAIFCIIGLQADAAEATAQPVNDFAGQILSNGKTGRVGISTREPAATLDVYQGEIKLGSTGAACTKALTGAIRFADDQLWVCNSYGWRPLVTGAPAK